MLPLSPTLGSFLPGQFAAAVIGLAALAAPAALAAEIAEPRHGVTIAYNDQIWSASADAKNVTLKCKFDACGGPDAECITFISDAKNGVSAKQFFWDFLGEFTTKVADAFDDNDYSPEIVDAATSFYEGGRPVGLSSIRFTQDDMKKRAWFEEIGEPFGVIVLQCYGLEARFEAGKAQWLLLANGVDGPKP